jgi:alpha-galactosidase
LPRYYLAFFLTVLFSVPTLLSQSAIHYQADKKLWTLQAGEATYAFGVNERGELQALYWGERIEQDQDLPALHSKPELASFDLSTSTTPQEYAGWGDQLEVVLKDILAPVSVHLYYRVYPEQGILARWSKIENQGKDPFQLEAAASATWTLPLAKGYEWSWLTGRWAGEWQLHTEPIESGSYVIESRRGSTSHQANPWFAVDRRGETSEENGPVWFGELGWSGSWKITVEDTSWNQVRITGGYNPFDFQYHLAAGESLETPPFYAGFTAKGKGEASRILHRFQLTEIFPGHPSPRPRPVLYNSWEATEFAVDENGQIALAEKAAKLGIERFVIDDGWFGQRNNDHRGLGDWYVNSQKFPHGLKPVIDRVHALGMDFGIWVEPEMVNPDSDLYRKHPEWAMNFPGRPRTEGRNQLLLNLARNDVKEYIFTVLDKLVTENDIAFLKWDYNRNWSEPGWDAVPLEDQKKIYVKYVENLYEILDRLRAKHPHLEIESCSGGGGRVDLGILRRTDEVWTSDNTDAYDRLTLQDGFTHAYSPHVMMAWVTDVPNFLDRRVIPLEFRFLSAMNGSLGVGGNLNKWSDEEMAQAQKYVAYYKKIRSAVQLGSLYRLRESQNDPASATEYVSQDGRQAVVFAFLHSQNFGSPYPTLNLQGLDPKARYRITVLDEDKAKPPSEASGSYLMHFGLSLNLRGDYDSTSVLLERLP